MAPDTISFEDLVKIGGALGGFILFARGFIEYRNNNRIKRAEFLDKLVANFSKKENSIALKLLDDFRYIKKEDRDEISPEGGFSESAQRSSDWVSTYDPEHEVNQEAVKEVELSNYLRNHKEIPIRTEAEIKVRQSFDHLLDFFTRLSYYLQNNLITPKELIYFRYYILKIKGKPAVMNYISLYFFESDFKKLFNAIDGIEKYGSFD